MCAKRVADIIIETLQEAGVKRCYGIVGDTLNYITTAIHNSDMEWVHVRHEEAGAFAAGAEAYMSDGLSACAGSCGPGSLHLINGVYETHRNHVPMIVLASQLATSSLGTDFPQEVDFKSVYASCSVFCEQLLNPEDAQRLTARACQTAIAKKGVAVLILPTDISEAMVKHETKYSVHFAQPVVTPSDSELAEMSALLTKGKKVGIYVGSGVKGAHDEVIELARVLKAPIAHTSRAKDFIEYDNPYNMGMNGMLGSKSGYEMFETCDTLLLLGADFAWTQFYPDKATIIQVDIEQSHLGRRHPVHLGVVGDVKNTAAALVKKLDEKQDTSFLDACLKIRAKAQETEAKEAADAKDIIHPQHLFSLVSEYADEDAFAVGDSGSAMVWLLRHFKTNGKRRTLASLVHGTMANALPQAMGIKKAYPDRQVISFSGDGGLSMLLGELLTVVQEKIDVKIIVLNNASLNFVELEQKVEGLVDHYTDLLNPNFSALAEVVGIKGWRVEKPEELDSALKAFLAHKGAALLDVQTNGYELVVPPVISAGAMSGMALYGAKAILQGRISDVKKMVKSNLNKA